MNNYFIDTNIISYILKDNNKIIANFKELLFSGANIKIPITVYYEISRGLMYCGANVKLEKFKTFCNTFGVVNISIETMDIASGIYADLREKGLLIEDADLFIGALGIEHGYKIITNNSKHFNRIKALEIIEWNL